MVKWLSTAILSGALALGALGCDKPKEDAKPTGDKKTKTEECCGKEEGKCCKGEKAKDAVKEGADKAADAVKEGADKATDAVKEGADKDAKDATEDAAKDAKDAVEGAAKDLKDAVTK